MPKLNWDGNDFRNSQDSSGTVAGNISRDGNLQQGYNHGSLTKGLVAYYPMEKGQGEVLHDGAFDNLGQIKPGSSGNNTKASNMWTTGQIGSNALNFDGNDDHVNLPTLGLSGSSPITVTGWFNSNNFSNNYARYIQLRGDLHMIPLRNDDSENIQFWVLDSGGTKISASHSTSSLSTGKWYAFASVFEPGEPLRLYIDGSLVAESGSNISELDSSNSNSRIAIAQNGADYPYEGKIDDVRIYNRTLSQPEITALANNTITSGVQKTEDSVPGQSKGGISRYKLNGTTDDDWGDNPGTNNGADLTATGVYGQASDFDGSNHIETPTIIDYNQGTVSTWIKIDNSGLGDDKAIFSSRPSTESERFYFRKNDGDKIELWMDEAWSKSPFTGDKILSEDIWYHVLTTWNGSQEKLYINGDLDKQESNGWTPNGTLSNSIGARNRDGSHDFNFIGKIDDVRIYDKALTPLQVEKLYNKGAYRISRESTLQ